MLAAVTNIILSLDALARLLINRVPIDLFYTNFLIYKMGIKNLVVWTE